MTFFINDNGDFLSQTCILRIFNIIQRSNFFILLLFALNQILLLNFLWLLGTVVSKDIENILDNQRYTTPANIYLFKVSNRSTRKKCEICSKLTKKLTLNIFSTFIVFLLLTLIKGTLTDIYKMVFRKLLFR